MYGSTSTVLWIRNNFFFGSVSGSGSYSQLLSGSYMKYFGPSIFVPGLPKWGVVIRRKQFILGSYWLLFIKKKAFTWGLGSKYGRRSWTVTLKASYNFSVCFHVIYCVQSQLEDNFTKLTIHEERENHVEERELQFEVIRLASSNLNRYLKAVRNVAYKLSKLSKIIGWNREGGGLPACEYSPKFVSLRPENNSSWMYVIDFF